MRRLLRQHWAVFSVLRSCALVKLYKAARAQASGCLQGRLWLLSVGSLVAAGEAGLGRHCCTLNPSLSSAGAACRVPESFLDRAEPESSTECHGVMHWDINTYYMLRHKKDRRGRGQTRKDERGGERRQQPHPPGPPVVPLMFEEERPGTPWWSSLLVRLVILEFVIIPVMLAWRLLLLALLEASLLASPCMVRSICSKMVCVFWSSRTCLISCRNCRGWSTKA